MAIGHLCDETALDYYGRRFIAEFWKISILFFLPIGWIYATTRMLPLEVWRGDQGAGEKTQWPWLLLLCWLAAGAVRLRLSGPPIFGGLENTGPVVALGTFAALSTSIAEEFTFRGILQPALMARYGALGFAFAQVLFVVLHVPGWILWGEHSTQELLARSSEIFILGCTLGLIRHMQGHLTGCFSLHAANNIMAGAAFS